MDRRSQLLELALGLIDEKGVRGASMRELARRAGVDVRSVYYHFASKRDMLRSLFEQAGVSTALVQPVPQEILDALAEMTAMDALIGIVEGNLSSLDEGAPYSRLIHVEVLHDDADAMVVGDEMWTGWGKQLEVLVSAAGLAGSEDVAAYARLLRSLLWGVFNESQLTGVISDPVTRRARAEEIAALLLR